MSDQPTYQLRLFQPGASVERIRLRPHKTTRAQAPGSASAHYFQRWLGECQALRKAGYEVTVLLARDQSHAVRVIR
jgi:hypothetical protein